MILYGQRDWEISPYKQMKKCYGSANRKCKFVPSSIGPSDCISESDNDVKCSQVEVSEFNYPGLLLDGDAPNFRDIFIY